MKIEPHHANINDSQFNLSFFQGFDIVFNALDNLAARRHVNKMCLAADVPLIESGTTGFNGQVQVIKKVFIIRLSKASGANLCRIKRNATIVTQRRRPRVFPFVQLEALRVSLFIA